MTQTPEQEEVPEGTGRKKEATDSGSVTWGGGWGICEFFTVCESLTMGVSDLAGPS